MASVYALGHVASIFIDFIIVPSEGAVGRTWKHMHQEEQVKSDLPSTVLTALLKHPQKPNKTPKQSILKLLIFP